MIKIISYTSKYEKETKGFILSILEEEFGYENIDRPDLDSISRVYQEKYGDNFWVALYERQVVGTIAVKNYGSNRCVIKRFYVKKEVRKKGVGQELFNTLLEFVKQISYQNVYLSTVEEFIAARKFYIKNGFHEIKSLPDDIDSSGDNVYMCMNL